MKTLLDTNIEIVRAYLKGKRLEKFDASIAVLKESAAQGCWTLRGSVKANSGFYQGICKSSAECAFADRAVSSLQFCLNYGHPYASETPVLEAAARLRTMWNRKGELVKIPSDSVIAAWAGLCNARSELTAELNDARPAPRVTAIGLSPKVTATLTEMNLDLDLPSIRPAKIDSKMVPTDDLDREGNPKFERVYFVSWTAGIAHGQSRFQDGCHACGKHIPSRRFVPIEAMDKKSGKLISMWLGVDCARNIFGIKDDGIEKETA